MRASVLSIAMTLLGAACLPQLMGAGAYGAASPFSGTFATQGGTITLQEAGGQVSGTMQGGGVSGQITGYVTNGQLAGEVVLADGTRARFTAYPTADGLSVSVPGRQPIAFVRTGAGAGGAGGGVVDPSIAPSPQMADTLAGTWWHYHGTSSGYAGSDYQSSSSYERTIELCRDGTFYDSDESNISSSVKSNSPGYDGWGNPTSGSESSVGRNRGDSGSGRWTATGDDAQGQLQLSFNNGTVETKTYVFRKRGGGDIDLDGKWFGWSSDRKQCQ